eukprot:s2895_g4.t1
MTWLPYESEGVTFTHGTRPLSQEGVAPFAPFKKEVYEGLFDRELMLRLDGVVLPEVPQPPLQLEGEDAGCALRLWAGAHMIQKAHGACEDAFFMDPHGLGVADGVGCMVQFASYGINAAKYATELMEFSSAALKSDGVASEEKIPNDVVGRAATALQHAESQAAAYGASTVAVLCQQGNFLGVANLGDSGFMVLRKGPLGMSIVIKSEEQQHSWNCPYQLTRLPKTLLNRFPKLQLDKASDCERFTVPIREGDLVIMFSDGLRDNLHDREACPQSNLNPEKGRLFVLTYIFKVVKWETRFPYYGLTTSQPSSSQIILAPPRLASSGPLNGSAPGMVTSASALEVLRLRFSG